MLKTVKSKVIAGTTAVLLLTGGGVAFGASDAGTNLQHWYSVKFLQSSAKVTKDTYDYADSKKEGLINEYAGIKADAGNAIDTKKSDESAAKTTAINDAKKEHIDALNKKKREIEFYMSGQFKAIELAAKGVIEVTGKEARNYAFNDLTSFTGEKGKAAKSALEADLAAVQAKAITDLETAIDNAKNSLQSQLDSNTAASTEKIKGMIDNKINQLRGEITKKKDELVAAQTKIISDRAAELEAEAKAALDAVVGNIKK